MQRNENNEAALPQEGAPDPGLTRLLRSWQVPPAPPPGFATGVWRRIRRATREPPIFPTRLIFAWFNGLVQRPRFVAAYLGVLLVVGASLGWFQGSSRLEDFSASLQGRYLQSIDPFHAGPPTR